MIFEISYIEKQEEIESFKRTICDEEFESMIHVMKFRSKKTFICDATVKQNDLFPQEFLFTQSSIYIPMKPITCSSKTSVIISLEGI